MGESKYENGAKIDQMGQEAPEAKSAAVKHVGFRAPFCPGPHGYCVSHGHGENGNEERENQGIRQLLVDLTTRIVPKCALIKAR